VVVSASGRTRAIFDDLLLRHGRKRHALVSVSNFTVVPHLLAGSDMIGVFTQLAAHVFERSFKLEKRPVPINVGKISTNMVWHSRNDRDNKSAWLRDQVRAVYRNF
jgi:DNA-binding transcriptional LysR family regulator